MRTSRTIRTLLLCALPAVAGAQWPPTYDYVPGVTGVQPPSSTAPGAPLDGYEQRVFKTWQIAFNLAVPLADVQAVLPPGFTAMAIGPATASLGVAFVLDQVGVGTSPPYSYATFFVSAVNGNLTTPRIETVALALSIGSPTAFEAGVALFGPGTVRLAEVEHKITTEGDAKRFRMKVRDDAIGLSFTAEIRWEEGAMQRFVVDPDARFWRFTDASVARAGFRQAYQGDFRAVPVNQTSLRIATNGDHIGLPAGAVKVLGFTGTVSFGRHIETYRRMLLD